ncbi:MAG TPA: hypothetical protein VFF04_00215 [Candidatus Babeliales bacterium]|nr:hypothetical protein [Candidatus Babeliales bacterium]
MWPLPSIKSELVTISLTPDAISFSWMKASKKYGNVELQAYRNIPLTSFEYAHAIVFNPTLLKKYISQFLSEHKLTHAFVAISIAGPSITESIVEVSKLSPEPADFPFPKLKKLLWDYRYLYPDDNRFAFYVCGISRQLLAQYQLLSLSIPINLIAITTQRIALLQVYRQQYGAAFRHAQLARDIQLHNNDVHSLFSQDTIRRHLHIKPSLMINLQEQQSALLVSFGLFLMGKEMHAAN